jgi:hypothetical protein
MAGIVIPTTHCRVYRVKIRLTSNILGTVPRTQGVYRAYISQVARQALVKSGKLANGQAATEEAIDHCIAESEQSVREVEERGWTGFHQDDEGVAFLYNYHVRGFLAESARRQNPLVVGNTTYKQAQDKIKGYVFVLDRYIYLGRVDGVVERPLRAMTAMGPRIALARSDYIEAGKELTFHVAILGNVFKEEHHVPILRQLLAYGELQGLGQWRTGGHGQFVTQEIQPMRVVVDPQSGERSLVEDHGDHAAARSQRQNKDVKEEPDAPEDGD